MTDKEMAALLANATRQMQATWVEIVAWLRETNQLADIERALEQGRYDDAVRGIQAAGDRLMQEVTAQFSAAARAAALSISATSGQLVSYAGGNPNALRVLDVRRLEVLSALSQEQRQIVENVIRRGITEGTNPRVMARTIRESIGLTPDQEAAVESYRAALKRGAFADAKNRALHDHRFDPRLRPGLSEADVERMTERYRQNMLKLRAETIARTEALRTLHEGTNEAFRQAFESGELDPTEIEVTWSAAMDLRTRHTHRALHGQKRKVDEPFRSPSGALLRYPGDPEAPAGEIINCRCVLQRRMKPRRELAFEA